MNPDLHSHMGTPRSLLNTQWAFLSQNISPQSNMSSEITQYHVNEKINQPSYNCKESIKYIIKMYIHLLQTYKPFIHNLYKAIQIETNSMVYTTQARDSSCGL